MLPGPGTALVRAMAVVPVILLVLYAGLLGLLGLLCGRERRKYVMNLSGQAMSTAGLLMHGPAVMSSPRRGQRSSVSRGRADPPSLAQRDRYIDESAPEGDLDAG